MGDTSIRVSRETRKRLELAKREDESFDEVIQRLTEGEKWSGFGVLGDSPGDTREGMAEIRRQMRDGTQRDIEDSGAR